MRNLFLTFEPIIVEVSSEQASGRAGLVLGGRYLPRLKQVKSIRCIVQWPGRAASLRPLVVGKTVSGTSCCSSLWGHSGTRTTALCSRAG